MRHLKLALILLSISGCAVEQKPSSIPNYDRAFNIHDPVFDEYIEEAEFLLDIDSQTLVRFEDVSENLKTTTVGVCKYNDGVVVVQRDNWNKSSDERRLALILHELGHCDLRLKHTIAEAPKPDPCSEGEGIMHPLISCAYRFFIDNDNNIGDMKNGKKF